MNHEIKMYYVRKENFTPSILKPNFPKGGYINAMRKEANQRQVINVDGKKVIFGVEGVIILKSGVFWSITAYVKGGKWGVHHILISPNLKNVIEKNECFIRLDSGCLSGILGDTTCDCMEQLRVAQEEALKKGGVIVHIPDQDGRGWREYKMANQRIMHETKLDTITVAEKFYGSKGRIDQRTFEESALILKALGFPKDYKFDLGTKNPKKVNAMLEAGFNVSTHAIEVNGKSKHATKNLRAKYEFFKVKTTNHPRKGKRHARD